MEISQDIWPWTIPLDSHKKRDRSELGNSRFTVWRLAEWSEILFCWHSRNGALLHQILPDAVTASTTNISADYSHQTSFAENKSANTRTKTTAAAIQSATVVEAKRPLNWIKVMSWPTHQVNSEGIQTPLSASHRPIFSSISGSSKTGFRAKVHATWNGTVEWLY